jgi:hypothetical protein
MKGRSKCQKGRSKCQEPFPSKKPFLTLALYNKRAANMGYRRRWLMLVLPAGLLVGSVVVFAPSLTRHEPGLTEANARRIRAGMHLREVESIFGKPGTDGDPFRTLIHKVWSDGALEINVLFDNQRLVQSAVLDYRDKTVRLVPVRDSWFNRLLDWFGLR